jgi:hypothetical protein
MNNKEEILILITKYWNAETSIDEEKMISAYIRNHPDDVNFQGVAPLFQYFNEESKITYNGAVPLSMNQNTRNDSSIAFFFRKNLLSIAAMISLAIVSVFLLQQLPTSEAKSLASGKHVIIEDPDEAYETVLAALPTVATKLNQGEEKAKSSIESFNRVNIFKPNPSF